MFAELLRKSTHLAGLIFPILYVFLNRQYMIVIVGSLTAFAICVEIAKWVFPSFRAMFLQYLKLLLRTHEKQGAITGATYYLTGVFLCIVIFDKSVAIACILFIILGDTAAALVGKRWGRTKLIGKKSLEGSAACFVVCSLITLLLINPIVGNTDAINPIVCIMGAFIATLTELLPLRIDDNLTVPLISGVIMQLMINYLPF